MAKDKDSKDLRYTPSGIPLKLVYGPDDIEELDYDQDLGSPGEYPFVRGLFQKGYRHFLWQNAFISGFGLPEQTNQRQKYLRSKGLAGYGGRASINLVCDNATGDGYDADDPRARWEVGKTGVTINSLQDMERLLDGFSLEDTSVAFIIDHSGPVVLAMYVALADIQGVPRSKIRGQVNNDPWCRYTGFKCPQFPPPQAMRVSVDCIKFCANELPNFNPHYVGAYNVREAGINAIQEVGWAITNSIEVIKACIDAGIEVDNPILNFPFFFAVGINFFEEIAKIRAARKVWARIMKERFGAKNPKSWRMKVFVQNAGSSLTAQEPLNNIGRIAIEAVAAALAGVQGISTDSYDEAICIPTDEAVRIAVKTTKIIEEETGVMDVVDPLGGSYYVESLTREMEREIWEYIAEVERQGGALACIENGFFQKEQNEALIKQLEEIRSGKRVLVGVNKYVEDEEAPVPQFQWDPNAEEIEIERLRKLRKERDNDLVKKALKGVRDAAVNGGDLMPKYIEAVKVQCTLGEIMDELRQVFGICDEGSIPEYGAF
ncbi:MAG: methylmalonyl-CoA mutase [Deltaproteobacteria bacterium]|nr:methylmalonyl-CoA mutase [Deltaproteobacteria bacterium]